MARTALLLTLLLAGCATSDPDSLQADKGAATVQGSSRLEDFVPFMDSGVTIEAVDTRSLKLDESQVVLPAGQHSFKVQCRIDGKLGEHYVSTQVISLNLMAGHTYKFVTEDPSADSESESNLSLLQSLTHSEPSFIDKILLASGNDCQSFAYDLTYDSHPYPAIVAVAPPLDPHDWKEQASSARSGYRWQKLYDSDVDQDAAPESMDTEYWSRLMFTDDAHARYQERLDKALKDCPQASISVVADTAAGLDYELDMPACKDKPPVELGRFLSDDYGLHRVGVLFKATPSPADRQAWLKSLDSATIQTL